MDETVSDTVIQSAEDDGGKKSPPNTDKDNLEENDDHDHPHQPSPPPPPPPSASSPTLPKTNRLLKSLRMFWIGLFPIFGWFHICLHHIPSDLVAGVYLGLYQIPQCMAYSTIARYPVVYMLRTNIISSTIYPVIGHHRRLSYGIFGLVSAIYFRIMVDRLDLDDTPPEMVAISVTFLTGLFAMLAGLLRLGSLVRFIPYEVLSGYRSGVYVLIISLLLSQMGAWKPLKIGDERQLMMVPNLFQHQLIPSLSKQLNWNSWGASIGCLTVLAFFRILHHYWDNLFRGRWSRLRQTIRRVPVEAILIIIGMIVATKVPIHSYRIFKFGQTTFGNETLIQIPHHFQWSSYSQYFGRLWSNSIHATILFLIYTHSLAIDFNIADTERIRFKCRDKRRLYPKKMKFFRMGWRLYNVNRELMAKGLIDLVGSLFRCVPCGPSRIRSDRCRNVGACTQVSGLIASIVAMVVWLTCQGYLAMAPKCIVVSIIALDTMVALLFEIKLLKNFWKVSVLDAIAWCLTFALFLLLNIETSLYCSLGLSLLIYCFRMKNFKSFKFKQVRALITQNDSVVLVPESLLDSHFENGDEDDNGSNIFKSMPSNILKSIKIYKFGQSLMTVSFMDRFVLDVCRKINETMKNSNRTNRIIFDCRSFHYTDWASIRLIKATVMRAIQMAESWNSPALFYDPAEDDKPKHYLIVVFVFPAKTVQMVHAGGRFNIYYYHSLRQTLHITMKGAIKMVGQFPQNLVHHDQNNNHLDTISSDGIMMDKISSRASSQYRSASEGISATGNDDKTESNKSGENCSNPPHWPPERNTRSKHKKLPTKWLNLDRKRQTRILDHENGNESDEQNIQMDSIKPISFKRQNSDEEFDSARPSTSSSVPRFEIIEEQDLANQFNISASTSSLERPGQSSSSESKNHSKSVGSILEPPAPPPPPPPSTKSAEGKSTSSSQTKINVPEISTKNDQTLDNCIETTRHTVSEMKNRLEGLLNGRNSSL